jgi:YfiH family protein
MIGIRDGSPRALVPLLRVGRLRMPYGVGYGFTTRDGGVAAGPVRSLTLARSPDVTDAQLVENWRLVLEALDPRLVAGDVALVDQVHGDAVLAVTSATGPLTTAGAADAMYTVERGVALAVRVADCVPVVLATPRAVGVAHAGWRGVASRIVPKTVAAMLEATGEGPDEVVAAIGPYIGQAAFEVGDEVVDAISSSGVVASLFAIRAPGSKPHVDLGAALSAQLHGMGVARVGEIGACSTEPRFFSYRRDAGRTGRMAGVVVRWA